MTRFPFAFLLGAGLAAAACPENFSKSGNTFTGTKYFSHVVLPDLSVADAIAQLHGVAVARKLDILSEDAANGNMLLEERATSIRRSIPYVVAVTSEGDAARVAITVKLNKGMMAKSDDAKAEICSLLDALKGGAEGRAAAETGGAATATNAPRKVDATRLSTELARQTMESAESIPLRYKDRSFTVTGRVDYVIKNGDAYRVAFKIPEPSRTVVVPGISNPHFKIDISCLMHPSQAAWALALRENEGIQLTGAYHDYDQFKKVMWLKDCRPASPTP